MNDKDNSFLEDNAVVLEDGESNPIPSVLSIVQRRYDRAKTERWSHEQRWLRAYRNYRGTYGPDVKFTDTEKSRVFVKATKTKTLAAYGRLTDVLFANNTFPISIEPSVLPEGVAESVHVDPNAPPMPKKQTADIGSLFGFKGDGKNLPPGATPQTMLDQLGPLKDLLEPLQDKIQPGPGASPTSITFHPAMKAAKKMEKKIKDQLDETDASSQLRSLAFECSLFGTGVMYGPFAVDKEYPRWVDGEYKPIIRTRPRTEYVPVWEFFPDPDSTSMNDCSFTVRRHKMNRQKVVSLMRRPGFRKDAIKRLLDIGENYVKQYWEDTVSEDNPTNQVDRFEVFEYWGVIDAKSLMEEDIDIPDNFEEAEDIQINVWWSGNEVLRVVLNPFKPARIPYYVVPYEINPYSIFGVGIAENMDDAQTLMNGFMRMAVDNAVLSGNLVFELDETNLVPGQDMKVYPGKVFRRQGGAPGQAIFGTKFPNTSNENLMLFDKARQLADESTGFPSSLQGNIGGQGIGRTAAGISMQMNAASGSIKTVVKNVDDYLLRPLGENLFYFNNQFDYDKECDGDLEVRARGTESLMQNEVRSQRLLQFLQIVQNPQLMPFAKIPYIVREIAKSLDLDPDLVSNNMDEAAALALILQKMNPAPPTASAQPGVASPAGATPPSDTSGGGGSNIGVGTAPVPNEQGFSGVPQ